MKLERSKIKFVSCRKQKTELEGGGVGVGGVLLNLLYSQFQKATTMHGGKVYKIQSRLDGSMAACLLKQQGQIVSS